VTSITQLSHNCADNHNEEHLGACRWKYYLPRSPWACRRAVDT